MMAGRQKAKSKSKPKRKKARVTKAATRRKTKSVRKSKAVRTRAAKKAPVRRPPNKLESTARTQTRPTNVELDQRIAMIRQNINDLVEQAAAFSGAGDESRTADRISQQEQELARLIKLRDDPSRTSDKP
jgi:hypothetical protein